MGNPFAGFPSLYTQLPAYQTLSPQLPSNFAPQLAGTRCLISGADRALWLINGMSTSCGMRREQTGSATTSVVATYQPVLVNAIVGIRNRHLPGCLVNE
jgi:hypothetical protein